MKKKKKKNYILKIYQKLNKKGEKKSNSIPTNHATHIHLFKARFSTIYNNKKCSKQI